MTTKYLILLSGLTLASGIQSGTSDTVATREQHSNPAASFHSVAMGAEVLQESSTATVLLDPKVGENVRMGDDPEQLPPDRRAQAEPHIARSWNDTNLVVAVFQEG